MVAYGKDDNIGCEFDDILAINCLTNRAQPSPAGAIEIYGADHKVS